MDNFISYEELIERLDTFLESINYSKTNIEEINKSLDNDPIHNDEDYMSEYVADEIINGKEYKHYHCWFNSFAFKHETYYLKEDLYDDSVEAYLKANKLYQI